MSAAACLTIVTVTVLGLIYVALRRDLTPAPCVQLIGVPQGWRRVQRTFAMAVVLALLLQMVPVNVPSPSETAASLVSRVPASLNTVAPYLSKAVAPLDALVPPFSNIQPAFADPTVGITITKSSSPWVNQVWGGNTEFRCAVTLTNPSAYTITISSQITDSVPISTTAGGGAPEPGWVYLPSVAFRLDEVTNTTSYAGEFIFYVDTPVPDGTGVANTTYCFTGTVGITPTQFCETTPITTEIRAPDFSLTESWTSDSGAVCAGQRLTYTITMSNPGRVGTTQPFTVTGVITDSLTIYTDTLSSDATLAGNVITWSITSQDLDANGANLITRTFAVSVPSSLANGTYLTNTYTFTSPEVAPTQDSWSSSGVTVSRTTAAFTSTSPVCLGETMVFTSTGEGATSYEWNFGDGITQTTTSTVVSHTYSSASDFTVVLTTTGACGSAVTQTTVTVSPLPSPNIAADPGTQVCYGQAITFTCSSCAGIPSYFWDFGDGTTSSLANPLPHTYGSPGTYTVTLVVTNSVGCSNSTTETVSVEETYASFTPSVPLSICVGAAVQFTDTSTSTCCLPLTRTWNFGDGTPTSTVTSTIHTFNTPGTFTVVLTSTNSLGCSDVATNTVFVDGIEADFEPSTPLSVCVGTTVYFTSTSAVSSTITGYQWDFGDGTPITTTVSPTISHSYNTPGYHDVTLTVTNTTGCSATEQKPNLVFVDGIAADFQPSTPLSVCGGTTVYFTDTSVTSGTIASRLWQFEGTTPVTAATQTVSRTYNTASTFAVTLTVTNTTGCSDTVTGTIIVNPSPVAGFTSDSPVCLGNTMYFTNTSTNATAYQWNFGDGSPITTTVSPTHVYTATGSYTVWMTATGACGSDVTSDTVTVNPSPTASFNRTPGGSVCTNQVITFTDTTTGSPTSWLWSFGDGITSTQQHPTHTYGVANTYTVWMTATNACGSDVTSDTITVNPSPTASFSRTPIGSVCTNQVITFTDTTTGSPTSWLWSFGDGITSTQQHPTHTYGVANTYTVWMTATNACGSDVTSDTITVSLSPSASFTATTPVCLGQAMTFTNTGSVGTYLWNFGDSITSTQQHPTHTYATAGTFTVWLTTTNACGSGVTSNTVVVNPLPSVSFASNSPVNIGETMYFTNTGDIGTYQWNFGDSSPIETTRDVTHIYGSTGNYVVWLTTTLGTGCWDTYSATVMVTGTTGCEDAYESDDSRAEATTVTPPSTTRHNFDDAADVDWVGFQGTAGITYTIETLNLTTDVDTKLYLYNWNGITLTQLASDDDSGPGFASLITWVVTSTSWYYVEVGRFTGSYYGCDAYYDLHIAGPPAYVYLPLILKDHPPPEPTPNPGPPPTPEPCYPMVDTSISVGSNPHGVAIGNGMIYVANYGSDSVWVIRQSDYGLEMTITPVGGANSVAYDGTHNLVYVTMRDSAQLAVLDASTNTVSETVSVGNGPNGVAYNPTANKIYVANYNSDTITILHGDTRALLANVTAPGETEPAHIAVNPVTNKVYVTYHGTGKVGVIDGDNDSLSIIDIYSAGPYGITVDTVRNLIYVATIDTHRIVAIGEKGGVPDTYLGWAEFHKDQDPNQPAPMRVIAVNPNLGSSGHLYATTDADDGGFNRFFAIPKGWPEGFHRPYAINVGNNPREGIAVNLSNNRVYVTARGSNRLTILEDGEPPCLWNFDLGFTVTLCRVGIDGDCR